MSAPHRGLPPPAAMMPSPAQGSSSVLSQLPQQWQNSEESVRTWLQAKMEEERRRAEEERTRQEQHRGNTRQIELEMMREAFKNGVPPPLVPLIFMGSGVVKTSSGEWVHEYVNQHLGMFQQQTHQGPAGQQIQPGPPPPLSPSQPPLRREGRSIHRMHPQSNATSVATPPIPQMGPPSGTASAPPAPPQSGYVPAYQLQGTRSTPTQPPAPQQPPPPPPPTGPARSTLPRINTNEPQIQQVQQPPIPPNVPSNIQQIPMGPPQGAQMPPHGPLPQSQGPAHTDNPPVSQSPSIFFHHWVPPNTQAGGTSGPTSGQVTASPQKQLDSPFSHHPPQNPLSGTEHVSSPKKRKTTAAQPQQPPPPSSQPFSPQTQPLSSPAVTPGRSRRGHSRNRSGTTGVSGGFEPYQRPMTRQRRSTGAAESSEGHPGQHSQYPLITTVGDNGRGSHSATGTSSQYTSHEQPRQQSAPPPQHSQPPPRPYSAGSDFPRQQPYAPPASQPPTSAAGDDGARK